MSQGLNLDGAEWMESMKALRVRRGDVIVFRKKLYLGGYKKTALRTRIGRIFPFNDVLVLDDTEEIAVVRLKDEPPEETPSGE